MLPELTRLTNAPNFLHYGQLVMLAVEWQPHQSADLVLRLQVIVEPPPTYEAQAQEWEVRCHGSAGGNLNGLVQPTLQPYIQVRVTDRHPVLWAYDSQSTVSIEGTCADSTSLLGALYLVHEQACGHWVAFHDLFGQLIPQLASQQLVRLEIPAGLVEVYRPVFAHHQLHYRVTHGVLSRYSSRPLHPDITPHCVLLFGNSLVSDENLHSGQPYQVAEAFTESRIR